MDRQRHKEHNPDDDTSSSPPADQWEEGERNHYDGDGIAERSHGDDQGSDCACRPRLGLGQQSPERGKAKEVMEVRGVVQRLDVRRRQQNHHRRKERPRSHGREVRLRCNEDEQREASHNEGRDHGEEPCSFG